MVTGKPWGDTYKEDKNNYKLEKLSLDKKT